MVKRAQLVGVYSLATSILQVIAFPLGTASGILMIIARSKSNNPTKVHKPAKKRR